MAAPSWAKEALAAHKQSSDDYKNSLRLIANALAQHEGSERVLERHVREARHVLAMSGNNRKPWYKRHELEITGGGGLIGASCSLPDLVGGLFPEPSTLRPAVVCAAMLVMLGIGIFLVVHGWLRVRGVFTT